MRQRPPRAGGITRSDGHDCSLAATLLVAGVDEAGRGPLAGPVVVAAVVFDPARPRVNGLDDSKQLCASRRETLYARIVERALAWHVVTIAASEIDRLNIHQATMLGMRQAVEGVAHAAGCARIDGNALPRGLPCPAEAWVGGDARDRSIMAASILAKVTRDRALQALHACYPHYGFDAHKGYGTPAHLQALRAHGPCPEHRRSFAPVRASESRDLFADLGVSAP
ncbi:ribonuclease HII [Luteimonas sp. MC1825]|uniref:ribonuclease HII n=1 Tax=Luteimonas sp. MC1825 TaxID=2761107 RepID=UPI00160E2BD6|nr:ribonuclease HII [Luteimonas sp. MC1825]MBB6599158.1 ribonuclease HII [Luteimonas sp. MC1825]QOC89281.1 ribonuclease HII [Luteimonas sp. MC1825]